MKWPCTISEQEVRNVVCRAKYRKAFGIDEIPNEVLKNDNMIRLLTCLYQMCFECGVIPSDWKRAVIKPIPKSSTDDPRIPMNYRGISLISCVAKLFTGILNHRISEYLESASLLAEEQNGFRKNRSCVDHIYTPYSLAKSRQEKGERTYVTFIDFAKFDCIDRDMLLYNLLQSGVDGKIYFAVKALYESNEACVTLNGAKTE